MLIAEHIRHLDLHAVHCLLGSFHFLFKVLIERFKHRAPVGLAALDAVQLTLHLVGELQIDDIAEMLLHQSRHHLAQRRGAEIFAFFDHVVARSDRRDRRRVGRRPADPLLLHGADQRRLGIAGGRLRELLLRRHLFKVHPLALTQARQRVFDLSALLVPRLLVHGGIAGELHLGIVGTEGIAGGNDVDRDVVVDGVCHLAGREAAPDQAVETVLLLRQILAHHIRRQVYVSRTDGLVGVLRAGLGLIAPRRAGIIGLAVTLGDIASGGRKRLFRKAQRVCSHIGDQADGAVTGDLHALIQLLGNGHRAARRHGQAARGLLLQRGGDKGRSGALLLLSALDRFDHEGRVLRRGDDRIDLVLALQFGLFIAFAEKAGGKAAAAALTVQQRIQQPVFLALKGADLLLAVHDHTGRNRLDAAGGKAGLDLFPQQR